MNALTFEDLVAIIRQSVTTVAEDRVLTPQDGITELGIDSITTLNIIMTAAEAHELDLTRLEDFTTPPTNLAELHAMLLALSPADAAA